MNPKESALRTATVGHVITALALVGLVGVYIRALAFTPVERFQGPAQKIFYVHVPSAWAAMLAFSLTGICSIIYLWLKDQRADRAAAASAEVGVVLSVVLLTTGPIWGKPIWGAWWTWDARLTSTLFMFLVFVGYLLMRDSIVDPETRGRFSAILGILGMALVPFVHITVYLFRTTHPDPVVLKPDAPSLPGEMLTTLLFSVAAFTLLYVGFTTQRYALAALRDIREEELQRAT